MNRSKIEELIASALSHDPTNSYTVGDVLKEVQEHRAVMWLRDDSLCIANVLDKPNARIFNNWIAAGDLDELVQEILPHTEAKARELGCRAHTTNGRRGWVRVLKPFGFEEAVTTAVKIYV